MIAAAVYFGLRHSFAEREQEDRGRPAALPGAARSGPALPDAPSPAPLPRAGTPRDEIARQVAQALDAHRPLLLERCWRPAVVLQSAPPTAKYVFSFAFDAQGRQLA